MKTAVPVALEAPDRSLTPVASVPSMAAIGERFNTATHAVALALSMGGGLFLLARTAQGGDASKVVAAGVFAAVMVMLYAASVLYHGSSGAQKRGWQRADHASIFLLIAGTCTPFALVGASGPWHRAVFVAIWLLAGWGVLRELRGSGAGAPSLALYLGMGWLGVVAALPVAWGHSAATFGWLLAGGLSYSMGTAWYRNPKGRRHAHGIWHLFVLGGSACHFMAVALLLTGRPA